RSVAGACSGVERGFGRLATLADRRSSGRRCGADIEYSTAESDIERVATEQIDRIHEHEQDRSLPPLCNAEQVWLAKHHYQDEGERYQRRHAIHDTDEPISGCWQRKRDRQKLVRKIYAN